MIPKIIAWEKDTVGWFKDKGIVYMQAPNGLLGNLSAHEIKDNGEVRESVLIRGTDGKGEPIEYHECVKLENYTPNQ